MYLFTYGTLRVGGELSQSMGLARAEPAELVGFTMHHSHFGPYPVIRRGPGVVKGSLYLVSDHRTISNILTMEVRAGYNAEWLYAPNNLRVDGRFVDKGRVFEVLAFTWPEYEKVGDIIHSGDWFAREEST